MYEKWSIFTSLCSAVSLGWQLQRGTAHICCCTQCCCWPLTSWFCSNRSISHGCWATAAKSQKRHANRTDGLTPNNCINPAPQSTYDAGNANNKHSVKQLQMSCLNLLLHWNEPPEMLLIKKYKIFIQPSVIQKCYPRTTRGNHLGNSNYRYISTGKPLQWLSQLAQLASRV